MSIVFDDIKTFLPKYLSEENHKKLFEEISNFPNNLDSRFYTSYLKEENVIFQGDGIKKLKFADLAKGQFYDSPAIILSNTCDIDPNNQRLFSANICYAPIFSLKKYQSKLLEQKIKSEQDILNHINIIRKQRITQIFYLPQGGNLPEECIVFLDRINHCSASSIKIDLQSQRLFTLSNYGFYIFMLKLSIHFTRIQEKVDRG